MFLITTKRAHKLIVGKHIIAAVIVTDLSLIIFSSVGKNQLATVIAIDHAFGFINWNRDAS